MGSFILRVKDDPVFVSATFTEPSFYIGHIFVNSMFLIIIIYLQASSYHLEVL